MSRRIAWLVAATLAGLVTAAIFHRAGISLNPVYAAGLGLAAAALAIFALTVRSSEEPVPEVAVEELPMPLPYRELISLEERMSWGAVDRQRFDARVRPHLLRVATERLRQRHGVRLADQPGQARDLMGAELYEFLTAEPDPAGRPVGRRELERVVARMEAL